METTWQIVRDVAIIILAVESIVIGLVLIITLLQLRSLTKLLQHEIAPMLNTANETVTIVRGTADFVGDSVVTPVMRLASFWAALRRALELLFGRWLFR